VIDRWLIILKYGNFCSRVLNARLHKPMGDVTTMTHTSYLYLCDMLVRWMETLCVSNMFIKLRSVMYTCISFWLLQHLFIGYAVC